MSDYKKQLNIRPNFHEAIFVNFVLFMSSIKWHSVFGFMVTLILSFMIASNIESYRNPDSVNFLRESLLTSIEAQSTDLPDPNLKRVYKNFMEDIEANLIEVKYKKVSLFRMIGCIVSLIGGIFLRKMKQIGLHLFISGNIFVLGATFYVFHFGLSGWMMNVSYLIFSMITSLFYIVKRDQLI